MQLQNQTLHVLEPYSVSNYSSKESNTLEDDSQSSLLQTCYEKLIELNTRSSKFYQIVRIPESDATMEWDYFDINKTHEKSERSMITKPSESKDVYYSLRPKKTSESVESFTSNTSNCSSNNQNNCDLSLQLKYDIIETEQLQKSLVITRAQKIIDKDNDCRELLYSQCSVKQSLSNLFSQDYESLPTHCSGSISLSRIFQAQCSMREIGSEKSMDQNQNITSSTNLQPYPSTSLSLDSNSMPINSTAKTIELPMNALQSAAFTDAHKTMEWDENYMSTFHRSSSPKRNAVNLSSQISMRSLPELSIHFGWNILHSTEIVGSSISESNYLSESCTLNNQSLWPPIPHAAEAFIEFQLPQECLTKQLYLSVNKCPNCNHIFKRKSALNAHLNLVGTCRPIFNLPQRKPKRKPKNNYECIICAKKFRQRRAYSSHTRIHLRSKDFFVQPWNSLS